VRVSGVHAHALGRRVLLLGGTSEIGLAVVRELQAHGPREVALVGRDGERLEEAAAALREAGCARTIAVELDAEQTERHGELLERTIEELGGVDVAILAAGVLGERGGLPADVEQALEVLRVNAVGAGSLLLHTAQLMRDRGGGAIAVLSSVAAERPRRANAVYGASKAALDALARGLGDELEDEDEGVRILVVRPGFVRTRMTSGLEPAPLATTPQAVAAAVYAGLDGRAQVIWVPRPLRLLMLLMKLLPRPVFRRIKQ
jgi:decaprenylphospho-beta-D-erythro-pentofuranosid-2-ulose 2-reductase